MLSGCGGSQYTSERSEGFHLGRAAARCQRPTALLTGRNRSESPATRSKSRPPEAGLHTHNDESSKLDLESLQKEIELKSGLLNFGSESISASMEDFINEGLLGSGTCSVVYKMRHRTKAELVMAVKYMRRSSTCQEENKRIMMDLNVITKSCDCIYIVQCYGIFFTTGDVWICMEVMPTCLDKLLRDLHRPFPEKVVGKITVSITTALDYLKRRHNVMHRDVKPSNMLLSYQGVVKLCDFGISGKLKDSIARSRQLGCIGYMAPERLETPTYDVRADIWSLGISLLELATGSFPYKGTELEFAIMSKIISEPPPSLPHHIPFTTAFRNFVDCCLKKDPRERPKYRCLMSTEFFCRHNVAPIDVLEWLRGLPLKHLHHPDVMMSTSISPATSMGSSTSASTLSPDMPRAFRQLALHDSYSSMEPKCTAVVPGLDVVLVSAPVSQNSAVRGTEGAPTLNISSANTSALSTDTHATFISGGTQQGISHVSLTRPPPASKTVTSIAAIDGVPYPSSRASSGYGSSNSDGSPASFTSGSRPSSASQTSDVSTSDCYPIPHRPSLCSPLNGTLVKHRPVKSTSQFSTTSEVLRASEHTTSPNCDQWSASASSSRTTTNRIDNHHLEGHHRTTSGTIAPLIQKFEPEAVHSSRVGVKERSYTPPVRTRGEIETGVVGCPGGSEHFPRQLRSPHASQNRSASVGAQLQRVCAQRWPTRPVLKKPVPVSAPLPNNCFGVSSTHEKFAQSSIQPHYSRLFNSHLSLAPSTLDYPTSSHLHHITFSGSNSKLSDDKCFDVPILPALLPRGNRLTQRLFTHPLPRQLSKSRSHRCDSNNTNDLTAQVKSHPSVIYEPIARVHLNNGSPSSHSSNSRNLPSRSSPLDLHNRSKGPPFETEL